MNPLESLEGLIVPFWAKLLAILAAVTFIAYQIYSYGVDTERAKWVNKENAELVTRQHKILELTAANRLLERKAVIDYLALKQDFERKLNDEKTHANAVLAAVRAGAKRLSIPTKQAVPVCSGGISLTAATGGDIVAETRAELSNQAAEFLIAFASDADQAVNESNHVKDLLIQCRAHVDALYAQSMSTSALRDQSLGQKPSNLSTILQLNSQPKEISND